MRNLICIFLLVSGSASAKLNRDLAQIGPESKAVCDFTSKQINVEAIFWGAGNVQEEKEISQRANIQKFCEKGKGTLVGGSEVVSVLPGRALNGLPVTKYEYRVHCPDGLKDCESQVSSRSSTKRIRSASYSLDLRAPTPAAETYTGAR